VKGRRCAWTGWWLLRTDAGCCGIGEEGNDAEAVGRRLAEKLLRLGAEEILSAVRAEVER